jgi:DNA-binding NarL/FixJ family response regulator
LEEVRKSGRPAIVTHNGQPVVAILALGAAAMTALEDWVLTQAPAALEEMRKAEENLAAGRVRAADDVRQEQAQRLHRDKLQVAGSLIYEVMEDGANRPIELLDEVRSAFPDVDSSKMVVTLESIADTVGSSRTGQTEARSKSAINARAYHGEVLQRSDSAPRARMTHQRNEAMVRDAGDNASNKKTSAAPKSARKQLASLSRREADVASLVAGGMTIMQVAAKLALSEPAVGTYISNILNKIGLNQPSQNSASATQLRVRATAKSRKASTHH